MGRELKRVPLNFKYPIGQVWLGYCPDILQLRNLFGKEYPWLMTCKRNDVCNTCNKVNNGECYESAKYCLFYKAKNRKRWFKEVPKGKGYQLWENTTEGSPKTPVFRTLEELCAYAEKNVSVFGNNMISKEQWFDMLSDGLVTYTVGNMTFI